MCFLLCRYVCARPAGKRCLVVSSNGVTVSRLRNGSLLHRFPSALPNGARTNNSNRSGQSYCILDCIFHEVLGFLVLLSSYSLNVLYDAMCCIMLLGRLIKLTTSLTWFVGRECQCTSAQLSSDFSGWAASSLRRRLAMILHLTINTDSGLCSCTTVTRRV